MYFNNVHIMFYVGIALLGLIAGKLVAWANICIPQKKKIFSKEYFKANKEGIEKSHRLMLLIAIIYIALLYRFTAFSQILIDVISYIRYINTRNNAYAI